MSIPAQRTGTEVSTPASNPFTAYGEQASQRAIVGTLLRFTKGDYLAGQDDVEVPIGTKFVANMDELMVGWIRWEDNRPTDHVMGHVSANYQPPRRNELGDTDKAMWEVDSQGKERDPWQFSNYLLFKGVKDEELYTFASSSKGGLNALGDLCKAYGKVMAQHPDDWPVIELGGGHYDHKEFGRTKVPVLKITGWSPKADFGEIDAAGDDGGPDHDPETGEVKEAAPAPATAKAAAAGKSADKPTGALGGKARF
ncbi:hypothetical protein [Bradyrhizobium elkanii]|uniref:hypothetical protein n=1 Tax=Bradyrhizobium elkanii TaxID=29448 RepID=UPI0004BB9FCD|nr:hypothetical protein [Bradyrhizobium elkanii]WLA79599.1 hypothetical protein QNJ99_29910 [Bradyrhizobium elkanii]